MALKPFVYWAQTGTHILMRVDLKDVVQPEVSIGEEEIDVTAFGIGAQLGSTKRKYNFVIEFFLPVDKSGSSYAVLEPGIQISLKKRDPDWWPRLQHQQQKLSWLRIDFERWKNEGDSDESGDGNPFGGMTSEDLIRNKYPDLCKDLERSEIGYVSESSRKVYLFCYNLFMFCGFLYVFCVMCLRYSKLGDEFVPKAYETVGNAMKMIHLLMALEVLHPLFGYTRGSVLKPALQAGGRNLVILVLIEQEPRMHEKPVVCYLFVVYTALELVRYPYYLLRTYNMELRLLTWLRYTLWVPFCPLGFMFEGVVGLRSIPYFEETERFSILLPNKWNFSFYLPNAIRIYLLFLFFPAMYTYMNQMYHQRCKKLNIKQHSLNRKKSD